MPRRLCRSIRRYSGTGGRGQDLSWLRLTSRSTTPTTGEVAAASGSAETEKRGATGKPLRPPAFIASGGGGDGDRRAGEILLHEMEEDVPRRVLLGDRHQFLAGGPNPFEKRDNPEELEFGHGCDCREIGKPVFCSYFRMLQSGNSPSSRFVRRRAGMRMRQRRRTIKKGRGLRHRAQLSREENRNQALDFLRWRWTSTITAATMIMPLTISW